MRQWTLEDEFQLASLPTVELRKRVRQRAFEEELSVKEVLVLIQNEDLTDSIEGRTSQHAP